MRTDLADGFKTEEIRARLQSIRVPVIMFRAEAGFAPGQPPLFPDAMMQPFRALVPQIEEHLIEGTTHYTIVLGEKGATRIANRLSGFGA